jgi:sensor histidine kinase regulating citrate/malate metabolism
VSRTPSVARQILRWQVVVVCVLVLGGVGLAWFDARADATASARQRALDLAVAVADSPTVRQAVREPDPSGVLQPFAEQVRRDSGTDFVVVMSPRGIRYSHPDPGLIGERFIGSIRQAQDGRRYTEEYEGTLGPSVRAVVPVLASAGGDDVVGLVSVGIRTARVQDEVLAALPRILGAAAVVAALGIVGAWLIHRRVRRQTHGLGEQEITRMYEYYDAVLRAVREGLVLVDPDGRVSLVNREAERLLDVEAARAVGADVGALGLDPTLTEAVRSGRSLADEVVALADRVLIVNAAAAVWEGREVGTVVTVRDRTELQGVTAELDTVRSLADSLRAHSHETANRLHTMVSLVEMGRTEEAVELATHEMQLAQGLTDRMVGAVEEPVVAALLLGKSAQAHERGVRLDLDPSSVVTGLPMGPHDAVTVIGNLLDNAIDAAQGSDEATVAVHLHASETHLDVAVQDSGPGIAPEARAHVFERGWSTKEADQPHGRGLGLALVGQVVRRHGGTTRVGTGELGGASVEVEIGEDA